MEERYWVVFPNGARQLILDHQFDPQTLAARVALLGARLECDAAAHADHPAYVPPLTAVGPLFRSRFDRIHACRVPYHLDINPRATARVLGGYYRGKRLVRIYSRDRGTGPRPLEELFDTFLHEMAHHLEYTEPDAFDAAFCGRVRGRMHSALFWRILGYLKRQWARVQGQDDHAAR